MSLSLSVNHRRDTDPAVHAESVPGQMKDGHMGFQDGVNMIAESYSSS